MAWSGGGKGGRGEYAAAVNSVKSNIQSSSVTHTNPAADQHSVKDWRPRRFGYALLVQQKLDSSDVSAVQVLMEVDTERIMLMLE
mgnify:CR=1 FL=1